MSTVQPTMPPTTLPETLARLRQQRGLSRRKLAIAAGISAAHYGDVEAGRREPGYAVLVGIAHALGVSLSEFDVPK